MIEIPDKAGKKLRSILHAECLMAGVVVSDPYEDYFEKQAEEKKEKIAKNEYKRLKNISRTQKGGRLKG